MGGYFKNDLIDTMLFLEEIQIKDKIEKGRFFSTLSSYLDNFPEAVCVHKILPQLLTSFHYGDAGSAVLAPMFKVFLKLMTGYLILSFFKYSDITNNGSGLQQPLLCDGIIHS